MSPADARGFTLVEATVSVAIMALVMGVVLVSLNAGHANLRKAAGQLSGTIRASYDKASLSGQTFRLAFSFDTDQETGEPKTHTVRVEATDEILSFDEDQNPLSRGAAAASQGIGIGLGMSAFFFAGTDANEIDDELDEIEDEGPPSALQALMGLNNQAEQQAIATFASTDHDLDLGEDVFLSDVWIQGMSEPASEGEVFLYLFPQGYTQDAYIHLEDESGAVFTVRVHALTGKTEVFAERVEVPK